MRKVLRLALGLACLQAVTACTYDSMRMAQRRDCSAMPQSLAERCYQRTQATKAEYDTKREELEQSVRSERSTPPATDPRYEEWLP